MKKIFLIFFILLISGVTAFAKNVDSVTAKTVATNFYLENTSGTERQNLNLELVYTSRIESFNPVAMLTGENLYYVFNVHSNTGSGFVIVSGDDIVIPVLGYSNEAAFQPTDLSPEFSKWMENYKNQIGFAKEQKLTATLEIEKNWSRLISGDLLPLTRGSVSPLLKTNWDQGTYYNALCPYNSILSKRTYTGCVATAMAQIMKYWEYPTHGSGFHSYYCSFYGNQSADFGSAKYDWASMPNSVTSSNNAVATLMYHCGVSVDMDYGVDGSSAYVISSTSPVQNCSEYAYKMYFGYVSSLQGLERKDYTDGAWKNLLKTDLDNSQPVQYAGFGSGGGHTWVCDGYNSSDYFHMNWGWGGSSNGYFVLDALNPGSLGAGGGTGGFNSDQQALIGIKPSSTGTSDSDIQLNASITITPNPIKYAGAITVKTDFLNTSSKSFSGDYCAALFAADGTFIDYIQIASTGSNPLPPGYHYTDGVTFSSTGIPAAAPGDYSIVIYYRPTGGNWLLAGNTSYQNPVNVTIEGYWNGIELYSEIQPSPSIFVQGQSASVTVDLYNDYGFTYYGQYRAQLYDLKGNLVQTINTITESNGLPTSYHYVSPYLTFSTSSVTAAPGTYVLVISEKQDGTSSWYYAGSDYYNNPVYVKVNPPTLSPDIYEPNNTQANAYKLPVTWSGNSSSVTTDGSNIHVGSDYDYYKIVLPAGFSYTITAKAHDSNKSGNGKTYSEDVLWSYDKSSGWSAAYDDVMPGNITLDNGGTVTFKVSPFFVGQTGTYLLDIQITRSAITDVTVIEPDEQFIIYPNPANDLLHISFSENKNAPEQIRILNTTGQVVYDGVGENEKIINVSNLSNGLYYIEVINREKNEIRKFIINR